MSKSGHRQVSGFCSRFSYLSSEVISPDPRKVHFTEVFRIALVQANKRIRKYHRSGEIFSVLPDRDGEHSGEASGT